MAPCYLCGTLFRAGTGVMISEFDSDREAWGARAKAVVGNLLLKKDT